MEAKPETSTEAREDKWTSVAYNFIGVKLTSPTWAIWLVFFLRAALPLIGPIIGLVYINDHTWGDLPPVMIVAGCVDFIWALLFFHIFFAIPIKAKILDSLFNCEKKFL